MNLRFVANEARKQEKKTRFASPLMLIVFIIISILLLLFFFPKNDILNNIAKQKKADRVAKQYLNNLVALYPENKQFALSLIEQNLKLGEINKVSKAILPFISEHPKTKTQWKALWLYYQIIRAETYAKPEISYERKRGLLQMENVFTTLLKAPLNSAQLLSLSEDAISMEHPETAILLYHRIVKLPADSLAKAYAKAGKFALSHSQYQMSAQLYFLAMKKGLIITDKRHYFMRALQSLQSGNMPEKAINLANQHINGLSNDQESLIFLTKLALAAGRPGLAQQYIKNVLRFKSIVKKPEANKKA